MSLFRRRRDDVAAPTLVEPPSPMARGEIAQRLGMPADSLLPTVRFAIRKEPDAAIDTCRSKLGGAPDVCPGTAWPSWTPPGGEKRLLQFFGQVSLSEVADAAPADLGLPRAGLLSFFADFDPEVGTVPPPEGVAILFAPSDSVMTRLGLRLVPIATAQLEPLSAWTWPASAGGAASHEVEQEQEASLRARAPDHCDVTGRHQIGGHIDGIDGFPLLQIDSNLALELEWGPSGAGRLLWSVPAADVARHDWTGARFSLLP